jgi:hypothetical protein
MIGNEQAYMHPPTKYHKQTLCVSCYVCEENLNYED